MAVSKYIYVYINLASLLTCSEEQRDNKQMNTRMNRFSIDTFSVRWQAAFHHITEDQEQSGQLPYTIIYTGPKYMYTKSLSLYMSYVIRLSLGV